MMMLGRARPTSAAVTSPLGSALSKIRVENVPASPPLELNARRSLASKCPVLLVFHSRPRATMGVRPGREGKALRSLASTVPTRIGTVDARSLSSASRSMSSEANNKKEEDSMVWMVVFSALVVGAIGFTVWQEVDGHQTQAEQRERNQRRAEERERREAAEQQQQQ